MAHPVLQDLFLLNDPETEAGKAGRGAGPVWWTNPYILAIASFGPAAQTRTGSRDPVLPRWAWGLARRPGPSPGGLDVIVLVSCQARLALAPGRFSMLVPFPKRIPGMMSPLLLTGLPCWQVKCRGPFAKSGKRQNCQRPAPVLGVSTVLTWIEGWGGLAE